MSIITNDLNSKYESQVRANMAQAAKQRASITASGATTPTGAPTLRPTPAPTFGGVPKAPNSPGVVGAAPTSVAAAPPGGKPLGLAERTYNMAKNLGGKGLNMAAPLGGRALNAGKNLVGLAGKVLTPLALAQGAAQSYGDTQNGVSDQFNASMDDGDGKAGVGGRLAETLGNFLPGDKQLYSDLGNNTLRTMGNVGDALTGGYASKFGAGVSASAAGGDFSEGFANGPRANLAALRNAPAPEAMGSIVPGPAGDAFGSQDPNKVATSTASTVTQVAPGSYQSNRLAEMGIPVSEQNKAPVTDAALTGAITDANGNPMGRDGSGAGGGLLTRQTSAPGVTNLGSYGGDSNIYATASKPGGRLNQFYGVGAKSQGTSSAPESAMDKALRMIEPSANQGAGTQSTITGGGEYVPRTRSIDAQFDALVANNKRTYSGAGAGNGARALLEIEKARSAAHANDQNNLMQSREQSLRASTSTASIGQDTEQKRLDRNQRLVEMAAANQRVTDTAAAAGAAAAAKAQGVAEAAGGKAQLEGNKNYNNSVSKLFVESDNPEAAQEKFNNFVANTDLPRALGISEAAFSSLKPDEMRIAVARLQDMSKMQDATNASVTSGILNSGPESAGMVFPRGGRRDAAISDVTDGNLPLSSYLYSNLPFTDSRVQPLENGTVVPYADFIGDSQERAKIRRNLIRKTPPKKIRN
jgi:hypothetical protein